MNLNAYYDLFAFKEYAIITTAIIATIRANCIRNPILISVLGTSVNRLQELKSGTTNTISTSLKGLIFFMIYLKLKPNFLFCGMFSELIFKFLVERNLVLRFFSD